MTIDAGTPVQDLDTPQLLIDLDVVDANLRLLVDQSRSRGVALRVHFKSLKCAGLARYLVRRGVGAFLCAKVNEAEVLADAGFTDLYIANQIVGAQKLRRLVALAQRASVLVCVDDPGNVLALGETARNAAVEIGVLVEVDVGMARCGVLPGEPALALARLVQLTPGLRFVGLQGYDGHLQLLPDVGERRDRCLDGLRRLVATRQLIEQSGQVVEVVTGAGTGTWEFVSSFPGITEIQPGSFILMDSAYHAVRPEFGCALSIATTVVSRRPEWYVLDAGSKAISRDFGMPVIKGRTTDTVVRLSEEHTKVESIDPALTVGSMVEVIPTHCCATMNLHRQCLGIRHGHVETVWPVEASGRYD